MNRTGFATLLLILAATIHAAEEPPSDAFQVSAEIHYLAPAPVDSFVVVVTATNVSSRQLDGCFLAWISWNFVPTDSLVAVIAARRDSLAQAGEHACGRLMVNSRLGSGIPGDPFECHERFLAPGERFTEILGARTQDQQHRDFPGTLDAAVTIWYAPGAGTWREATAVGSCRLTVAVPRRGGGVPSRPNRNRRLQGTGGH